MGESFQILRPSSMRACSLRVCSFSLTSIQYLRSRILDWTLDARPVVPAAIEDHDLAGGGQMGHVALRVELRLLALGGGGEGDHPEDARAHALGDGFDGPALAGAVAALEDDTDLEAFMLDPLLELDELDVQLGQLLLVGLPLEPAIPVSAHGATSTRRSPGRRCSPSPSAPPRPRCLPSAGRVGAVPFAWRQPARRNRRGRSSPSPWLPSPRAIAASRRSARSAPIEPGG